MPNRLRSFPSVLFAVAVVLAHMSEAAGNSPVERKDVRLAMGSNAASVWLLNGGKLVDSYGDRQTVVHYGVSDRVTLKKRQNTPSR